MRAHRRTRAVLKTPGKDAFLAPPQSVLPSACCFGSKHQVASRSEEEGATDERLSPSAGGNRSAAVFPLVESSGDNFLRAARSGDPSTCGETCSCGLPACSLLAPAGSARAGACREAGPGLRGVNCLQRGRGPWGLIVCSRGALCAPRGNRLPGEPGLQTAKGEVILHGPTTSAQGPAGCAGGWLHSRGNS